MDMGENATTKSVKNSQIFSLYDTLILRKKIKFCNLKRSKTAILAILEAKNFDF